MKNTKRILCLAAALLFALSAASCNFSTAKLDSAVVTDADGNVVTSYTTADTIFYAQANLSNAPERTKVVIVWTYIDQNQVIDQTNVYSEEDSEAVTSTLEAATSFPTGQYKVEFFVEDRKEADASVTFTVVDAPSVSIEDAHMTSEIDSGGTPVDTITEVEPTGIWYVTGILRNTQPDTTVRFVWYDSEGTVIDEYTLDPEGQTDVYINGTMELSQVAPEGTYRVEMFIDDNTEPAASVPFEVKTIVSDDQTDLGEFATYSQTEGGFTIEYPVDWTVIDAPESLAAIFYPKEYEIVDQADLNDVYVIAFTDSVEGYTTSEKLDDWAEVTIDKGLTDYYEIERTVDTVNGMQMGIYAYSFTRDSYSLYNFDFLVLNGSDMYLISLTCTDEVVQTLFPYLEHMVLSFGIL